MSLLDLLAKFGPYAFVLMSVWFSLAFVVAAWRVRRWQSRGFLLSLLSSALIFWLWLVLLFQNSFMQRLDDNWFQQVLWYFIIVGYLCLSGWMITQRMRPTWRQAGYHTLGDVLFLRSPATTEQGAAAPLTVETSWATRPIYLLLLSISVLLLGITFLGNNLRPCQWLDIATQYSGCVQKLSLTGEDAHDLEFSPDGSALAVQGGVDMPLQLYRLADGALLWTAASAPGAWNDLSFSPEGKTLASVSAGNKVSLWDWQTGQLQTELSIQANAVQFSPDGQYLATGAQKSGIQLWRVSDWTPAKMLPAQKAVLSFSPDGQLIAGVGISETLVIWRTTDGTLFRTLTENGEVPDFIAYSPDGTRLASSAWCAPIHIWDITANRLTLTLPASCKTALTFSPDGQFLLVADWESAKPGQTRLTLWRVTDGQLLMRLEENDRFVGSAYGVAFAPDGKTFAYTTRNQLKRFRMPAELQ